MKDRWVQDAKTADISSIIMDIMDMTVRNSEYIHNRVKIRNWTI